MKNIKTGHMVLAIVALFAVVISSCSKNNNQTIIQQPITALNLVDASPDAGGLDMFINTDKIGANPIYTGQYTGYFNAYAGKRNIIFYQQGTSSIIAKDSVNLLANNYYTLFLANVKLTPDFILIKDSLYKPASGMASVRFINASPDVGAVDFVIRHGATLVSNATYKSASGFVNIPVNTVIDTLQIRRVGDTTVLATAPIGYFNPGTVLTVWLYGLANTTVSSEKLNANIMQNAYYYQ